MEYFNTYTNEYIAALYNYDNRYLLRLELLSDDEKSIGDIIQDLDATVGQININYEQITRRSCSLALVNVNQKYLPSKNSAFWFNRKFKLWIGLVVRDNVYWWSQGVYYTRSATSTSDVVNIEAVDKGGALDGSLKANMTDAQYIVKQGSNLVEELKQMLALPIGSADLVLRGALRLGGDKPMDVIPPRINTIYKNEIIQNELTIDTNTYMSELILQLTDLYNAEAYYDANGNFIFEPVIDNYGYNYVPTQWSFSDLSSSFENPNYQYSFEGENAVCVFTNASGEGIVNVAYTAYNTNPLSPLNISIGIHRSQDIEIPYYLKDNSEEIKQCQEDLKKVEYDIIQYNIDTNQTVYGNIDTNNRQKLVWTQDNLTLYADELASWDEEPEEGSFSTIIGMSTEFDGVEIAFSPMLQTANGAVLLISDVVYSYIETLISALDEDWTKEDLLAADIIGIEIDGVLVKELIADAGETAIHTGIAMHYVGKDGALAIAQQNLYDAEHANEIQQIKDCRSAATYYLKKNSMLGMQLNFNCPIIPHLDVNKTIEVSDKYADIANGIFVIQSITIPLSSNAMNVSATNINWLPNDMQYEGTSELLGEESED